MILLGEIWLPGVSQGVLFGMPVGSWRTFDENDENAQEQHNKLDHGVDGTSTLISDWFDLVYIGKMPLSLQKITHRSQINLKIGAEHTKLLFTKRREIRINRHSECNRLSYGNYVNYLKLNYSTFYN